jgi:opacity protein-like surface antigen
MGIEMRTLLQIALCVPLAIIAMAAHAQTSKTRAGLWDFTMQPQYTESATWSGANGSEAQTDGGYGFGFGLAYNFNDHLSMGGDLQWGQADYKATVAPAAGNPGTALALSGELYTSTLRLNGTWNLLATAFTPFVTGGIGATYVDTNIPDGPPSNVCWWDPWWGYYCGTVVPTKTETYFTYSAGAGLRWDLPQSFFLRALAARQWLDVGGDIGTPDVTQYRIDLGFRF